MPGISVTERYWNLGQGHQQEDKRRAKFGGMEASDAKGLLELESENAKLKHLLADAHLDMHAHKSLLGVKR